MTESVRVGSGAQPHEAFSKWRAHVHQRRGGSYVKSLPEPKVRTALAKMRRAWKSTIVAHEELAALRLEGTENPFEWQELAKPRQVSPALQSSDPELMRAIKRAQHRLTEPALRGPDSAEAEAMMAAAMYGVFPKSLDAATREAVLKKRATGRFVGALLPL